MKDQTRGARQPRRQHDRQFKDELIAQSLVPGASVSAIAMSGGINANLLFKWRRAHLRAKIAPAPTATNLLPVCVIGDAEPNPTTPTSEPTALGGSAGSRHAPRPGVIEIEMAGAQLRLRGAVDETVLSSVLRALRHSA